MKLICFDCDSTLSAIEGIDELARLRGPELHAQVEAMTREAMEGRIPVESVFGRRLEAIRPSRAEIAEIGRRYVAGVEPTAVSVVSELKARGWTSAIVSAGFTEAIRPLADLLGISLVRAVDLTFTANGAYLDYDRSFPATRSGGKPLIVKSLKNELSPVRVVAVGDGVSDLETKSDVDLFIGFGRYVARPRVEREAGRFIRSLDQLLGLV